MLQSPVLKVQKWGNSLAVRIPAALAKSAGLQAGQPVKVSAQPSGVLVTVVGELHLTLAQRLALFHPEVHGGELMSTTPIGKETFSNGRH